MLSVPQKIVIAGASLLLAAACLYVPYRVPDERGGYAFDWVWRPVKYRDPLNQALAEQLDLEKLSKEFSAPVEVASQSARPALGLFAAEALAILALGAGVCWWMWMRKPDNPGGILEAEPGIPPALFNATALAGILLVLGLAAYTRSTQGWSGQDFKVQVSQVRMGAPIHWLGYNRIAPSGFPRPGEDFWSAYRTLPDWEDHSPGLSIEVPQFVLAVLCAAAFSALLLWLAGLLSVRWGPIPGRSAFIALSSAIAGALFASLGSLVETERVVLVLAILGLVIPALLFGWGSGRYRVSVSASFISIAVFWWGFRMWDHFREDHFHRDLDLESDGLSIIFWLGISLGASLATTTARRWRDRRRAGRSLGDGLKAADSDGSQ